MLSTKHRQDYVVYIVTQADTKARSHIFYQDKENTVPLTNAQYLEEAKVLVAYLADPATDVAFIRNGIKRIT
jgi:hypothetical protein